MQQENVNGVNAINDTGGFPFRKKYYKNARKKDVFDIARHYEDIYDNGTESHKEEAKAYLRSGRMKMQKKIVDEINAKAEADKK